MKIALRIGCYEVIPSRSGTALKDSRVRVSPEFFAMLAALCRCSETGLTAREIAREIASGIKIDSIRRSFSRYASDFEGLLFDIVTPSGGGDLRYRIPVGLSCQCLDDSSVKWLKKVLGALDDRKVIEQELIEIEQLALLGNADRAIRIASDPQLKDFISKLTPKRSQNAFELKRQIAHGGALMSRGRFVEAASLLGPARRKAKTKGLWKEYVSASGNLGAALRMRDASGVHIAKSLYEQVLFELKSNADGGRLEEDERYELIRWLGTNAGFTGILFGDYGQALYLLDEALDESDPDNSTGVIETRLRRMDLFLRRNDIDRAETAFEAVLAKTGLGPLPTWIKGWIPRHEALLRMAQGNREDTFNLLQQAWDANEGFGFQRILVAKQYVEATRKFKSSSMLDANHFPGLSALHASVTGTPAGVCGCKKLGAAGVFKCLLNKGWAERQLW
jgi:tetratricopeptide (TPR) repeat protein